MANTDSPFGFKPWKQVLRVQRYICTNNSVIGDGQPLIKTASGTVRPIPSGVYTTAAMATNIVVGVAAHFVSSASANARRSVAVYDHPQQWFSIQCSAAAINTLTDFGLNYAVTGTGAGKNSSVNRTTGRSKIELTDATGYTGATRGIFKIYDWDRSVGFITNTSWVKAVGQINPSFHWYVTGAGV